MCPGNTNILRKDELSYNCRNRMRICPSTSRLITYIFTQKFPSFLQPLLLLCSPFSQRLTAPFPPTSHHQSHLNTSPSPRPQIKLETLMKNLGAISKVAQTVRPVSYSVKLASELPRHEKAESQKGMREKNIRTIITPRCLFITPYGQSGHLINLHS